MTVRVSIRSDRSPTLIHGAPPRFHRRITGLMWSLHGVVLAVGAILAFDWVTGADDSVIGGAFFARSIPMVLGSLSFWAVGFILACWLASSDDIAGRRHARCKLLWDTSLLIASILSASMPASIFLLILTCVCLCNGQFSLREIRTGRPTRQPLCV